MVRSIYNKYTHTAISLITSKLIIIVLLLIIFSCSKIDDGDEHCPEGYTGGNCDIQITPDSVIVTKIKVIRFPEINAQFKNWDDDSRADIYPQLWYNNELIWTSRTVYENALSDYVYTFTPIDTIALTDPMAQYAIQLYDEDEDGDDDYMGGINFLSYYSDNGFPELLLLDDGGDIAFELSLEYLWD